MTIGVVGLWHLGCVLTACWLKLGRRVIGIDFDSENINQLSKGKAPLFEPHLDETLQESLRNHKVQFSTDPSYLKECDFIFLGYDTPVDENDCYDLTLLEQALQKMAPHLKPTATLIISSQVPVGTCRKFGQKMKVPLVYSPENLRLGEAMHNYLNPGHIVIGADQGQAAQSAKTLFSVIPSEYLVMDLPSAEMTKHAINSFLATSITFANQLADVCGVAGADFSQVVQAMKHDPRIGKKAYLKAGIGFSGGTLGRDLQILASLNQQKIFPLFEETWQYNKRRPQLIVDKIAQMLNKTVSLLGMTYKPGNKYPQKKYPP
jgi:UDPglucose 6-dehydrogenase